MPEKRREGVFSIRELPEEVQKRVLDRWRYKIWDDHDSQVLTGEFKRILSERGFTNPEVCWSLSYSQGDGMAFWGRIDPQDFFKWVFSGAPFAKPYKKEAKKFVRLQDILSVHVRHEDRYCHWNSMSVEVEVIGSELDLLPEKIRADARKWKDEKEYRLMNWMRDKSEILYRRNEPIREWNKRMDERSSQMKRGPKEWRPKIGPMPEPLDIPIPPEPVFDIPTRLQRMIDQATADFAAIDPLVNEFEEFISEWVKNTSKELEKLGYDEIEYRQSDEQIIEFLEANDYEFDEEGDKL